MHIVHSFVGVSEIANGLIFEACHSRCRRYPFGNMFFYSFTLRNRCYNARRDLPAKTLIHSCDFGHCANVVVAELHIGCRMRIIQMLKGLDPHQNLRNIKVSRKRCGDRRRNVGRKNNEKKIHVLRFQCAYRIEGIIYAVNVSYVDDVASLGIQKAFKVVGLLHELFLQTLKLLKINIVSKGHDCYFRFFHSSPSK